MRLVLVLRRLAATALATTLLLPAAAADEAGATDEAVHLHTTVAGDTLIGLGRRLLAEPARWPELARANALRDPNRIPVGTALRVPLRLMRTEPVPATLTHVVGEASVETTSLRAGQTVGEGSVVTTGPGGHVSIKLVDGTLLRLRPASRLRLRESSRVPDAAVVRTGVRLEQGRVEIEAAPAPAGRPGFRIDTPQGVLGVRGTEFRVTSEGAQGVTRGEVLAGEVSFGSRPGAAAQTVAAGFGSVIEASGAVAAPVRLLPPPAVAALPVLHEQLLVRFALPPLSAAIAYRGQVARDAAFDRVVADLSSPTAELRFAGLPDGDYVLRVRGVDALGLEGQNADHRFRLKARPEAPLPSAPQPRAVIIGGRVEFNWAANDEARSYRLRLATGADFSAPLRDMRALTTAGVVVEGLAPGTYHWQVASVRGDDDQGPWSPVRSFEIRPPPPTPQPPKVGDSTVSFAWEGRPGQSFDFEVARDAAFATRVLERRLVEPSIELPLPGSGRFYVRMRSRDADGFVGPYSTVQYFDVPNCVRAASGACVRAADQTLNLQP